MRLFEEETGDEHEISGRSVSKDARPLSITVLRNITVEQIEPYLKRQAAAMDRRAKITFGDYDNIVQEACGAAPHLFSKDCELVLVFSHLANLSPSLANNFAGLSQRELATEINDCAALFELVLGGIRQQTRATILWVSFEPPAYPSLGIADSQSEHGQTLSIARLNAHLRDALQTVPSAYLIDLGAIALKLGTNAFYDLRYWHLSKAPYSRRSLSCVAAEAFKFIRAKLGHARKCLVLDCDNTLWGGIVGEDGLGGIELGSDFPGSSYVEFQHQILDLRARGVLIALLSKNNEADVWEVFDSHPDMLLKQEHLSAWRVNWRDKASNMRELAQELNISLDSMVFVDDSDFELNLISNKIPEVLVVKVEARKASESRWKLASLGVFDLPELTDEDRKRNVMYAQDSARRDESETITDMAAYLKTLQIELNIFLADTLSIRRIAQQTQKTNQFNLTTKRYSEADILHFVESNNYAVLACRVADKHGDMGIIGSIVLEFTEEIVKLDTMLLSCRALGRGIEQRFLDETVSFARDHGAKQVYGEYVPTAKNVQVRNFLDKCGFTLIDTAADGTRSYLLDVDNCNIERHDYFASVMSPNQQ